MDRKFRDTAFTYLFKNEIYAVDLYEEVKGIRIDPTKIKSVSLQDGFTKTRIFNDVAFLNFVQGNPNL